MTSLRLLVTTLFLLAATPTHAARLRTKDNDTLTNPSDSIRPSDSLSDSSSDDVSNSSEDITQDSTTSQGSNEIQNIVMVDEIQGVKAWGQCGGLYYLGETECQQFTSCKQLSDFISVCFPESRPTEQIVRLEL
ncbi:RxLR-like protein [Plasmopara halstedii]|uniref:RxLR-like protein n=1 Tax=Plasmopara halstedii TaxID=4781 RepID=A0A0P1AMU4_PLAHL|nr:RxLR-like protein [Plasmopara halstedii]CEG42398.1 RxLR-like protein [Plasmopara halstedii]|eukprot:XP_024578767.1 RxLR-like protein [Plasmopara halstedii]